LAQATAAAKEEMKYDPTASWHSLALALQQDAQTAVAKLSEIVFAPANYNNSNERGSLRIWNYQRGYVALRQGRVEEAINHFRAALQHRAVEWNIDSFEDCLANAYLELGRWDEAIGEYERVLKINPRYPLAAYHLGQIYERKGETARARAAYEQFLQDWQAADADIPEVRQAAAWLANPR
jgi:tetratricopeptide (TPR) repeat protein